jgi:hypothetical protein
MKLRSEETGLKKLRRMKFVKWELTGAVKLLNEEINELRIWLGQ